MRINMHLREGLRSCLLRRKNHLFSTTASDSFESTATSSKKNTVTIFGGNGYVGQAIARNLLEKYSDTCQVISISRSGQPQYGSFAGDKGKNVLWLRGDVEDSSTYKDILKQSNCVISCIGAFGSDQFMEKINGDANITAINESVAAGVKRFIFLSTVENTLPEAVLRGYFNGKRRAEQALLSAYPENGVVLKPGFMYGTRHIDVNGREVQIPLGLVGKPLEMLLSLPGISNLKNIPGMRAVLARPLDVNTVGRVAADIAINGSKQSILSEDDIANF